MRAPTPSSPPEAGGRAERSAELLVETLVEIINACDLDRLEELYSADYIDHDPLPGQPAGIEGVRSGLRLLALPDASPRFHLEDCFGVGDRVAYRLFGSWLAAPEFIFEDSLGGRRAFQLSGVGVFRCEHGRLAERWGRWDIQASTPIRHLGRVEGGDRDAG